MPRLTRGVKRVRVRERSNHPRRAVSEAAFFDYAIVKNSQHSSEVTILAGAGPRDQTFAKAAHRKGANFEDLELFLRVLQRRYGSIPVQGDQEECYTWRTSSRRRGLCQINSTLISGHTLESKQRLRTTLTICEWFEPDSPGGARRAQHRPGHCSE